MTNEKTTLERKLEDVQEVPEGKRKGQTSILKY